MPQEYFRSWMVGGDSFLAIWYSPFNSISALRSLLHFQVQAVLLEEQQAQQQLLSNLRRHGREGEQEEDKHNHQEQQQEEEETEAARGSSGQAQAKRWVRVHSNL